MTPIESSLVAFARWVIREHRDSICDVGGGDIQDKLVQLGLLVSVPVTEPCGEACLCAEYGDFPQDCLRLAEGVTHD